MSTILTRSGEEIIFITGGTGFVGREIVLALSRAHPSWRLFVFDLEQPAEAARAPNVSYIQGDVLDPEGLKVALSDTKATGVIHTAGVVPPLTQRYGQKFRPIVQRVNVEGTRAMLAAARAQPTVRAFVWTGSCCAVIDDFRFDYPNVDESWETSPNSHNTVYGESKAVAEALVLAANEPGEKGVDGAAAAAAAGREFLTCSLRPSTLFGDTDSQLLGGIHALIASGETPFVIGDGLNLWDVCHAANVADAHVLAVENLLTGPKTAAGEAFFIGNEEPIPFRTFCLAVWREFGHVPPYEITVAKDLAWFAGLVAETVSWAVGREPGLRRASVADATAVRYADGRKARMILGYRARIPLHEGIARSCALYKRSLDEKAASAVGKKRQ